jgi:hypothetical protein
MAAGKIYQVYVLQNPGGKRYIGLSEDLISAFSNKIRTPFELYSRRPNRVWLESKAVGRKRD